MNILIKNNQDYFYRCYCKVYMLAETLEVTHGTRGSAEHSLSTTSVKNWT